MFLLSGLSSLSVSSSALPFSTRKSVGYCTGFLRGGEPVSFCIGRSELNGTLSRTKGFCIPLQFHEDRALIRIVGGMGRSTQDCSFKGIQGLFVVAGGRED